MPKRSAPVRAFPKLRTVYLGTSRFAVDVLEALAESRHKPALVVTPPDRPRGRGRRMASPPVADAARALGIELYQTARVSDEEPVARIDEVAPGALVVCQFGQLIKEPLLSSHLILNVHPSLLPRWRGAAPIERALMSGDKTTGMTIFKITEGLDSGPIALVREEPVRTDDTAGTLAERLSRLGAELMIEALDAAEEDRLELVEQREEGVTYAEKIDSADRQLDPRRPADELERTVRAMTPGIGAYLELEGAERLGVGKARVAGASPSVGELAVEDGRLLLGCADGALELIEVKPAGKRAMSAAEYLRGHPAPARALLPKPAD
jgi:methionyl-tRNA formyltransferase